VEFIGEYDAGKKIIYATKMNLLKSPSPDLLEEIETALEEYSATKPVSGKGYIILEDGEYKLEVKNQVYTIETEVSDIEVVLPFVADDEDLMIELIGPLNKEDMVFKAEKLNFLTKIPDELMKEINEALLDNKDGKEVDARGYIRDKDGVYSVKIHGESYTLVLSEEYPDVLRIVPVLANEEILINVVGILDRANKKIAVEKVDIIDKPSIKLQKEIAAAIEGFEEGNANVRGNVVSKTDGLYLNVKDKEYKMIIEEEQEDVIAFLNVIKDEDEMVQVSGFLSNKNKTITAGALTLIGQPSDSIKAELAEAMSEHVEIPATGKLVDAKGEVIEKSGKYYISVAFHDYLIKTPKIDMQKSLVVLSESGIPVVITGKINNEERFIDAEKLVITETPSADVKAQLDKIMADAKATNNGANTNNNSNNNNPFGNFGNFGNFAGFGNLFGNNNQGTNTNGETSSQSNPFANFNFGNMFGGTQNSGTTGGTTDGTTGGTTSGSSSPFGNFGSLFQNFFGSGSSGTGSSSPFSSLFSGTNNSGMQSLSFDQIQQQLNNMGTTPTTSSNSSNSQGVSFGSGSGSTSGSGFSVGEGDSED
jgi:hypothetical protein